MILVTGASGKIGSALLIELERLDVPVRALSRDAESIDRLAAAGIEAVQGDLADPGSLARAVAGVDVAFLLSSQHPDQAEQQGNLVRAALDGGVQHLVKLSGGSYLTAEASGSWVGEAHWQTEREIVASGIACTFLHPNYFMQNLLPLAGPVADGKLPLPIPDGQRLAMIDTRDVGVAAARVLADPAAHRGRTYELTGPEAIDFATVAERMSAVLGHRVEHVTPPLEAAVAALADKGAPEWLQRHFAEIMGIFGSDPEVSVVRDDFERLVGRSPRPIDSFLRDYASTFQASGTTS